MNVYRIECFHTEAGCMSIATAGLGTFMCDRGLHATYDTGNEEVDWSKRSREYHEGIFFFTAAGWREVGYPMTQKLNRSGIRYRTLKGKVIDQRKLLYKDKLQIVIKRINIQLEA